MNYTADIMLGVILLEHMSRCLNLTGCALQWGKKDSSSQAASCSFSTCLLSAAEQEEQEDKSYQSTLSQPAACLTEEDKSKGCMSRPPSAGPHPSSTQFWFGPSTSLMQHPGTDCPTVLAAVEASSHGPLGVGNKCQKCSSWKIYQ